MNPTETALAGDELLAAVTDAMVTFHERYHGRKPGSAKSQLRGDDLLACVLGGVYTEVEKTMIELERATVVQETRSALQEAMQQRFIAQVSASRGGGCVPSSRTVMSGPIWRSRSSCSSRGRSGRTSRRGEKPLRLPTEGIRSEVRPRAWQRSVTSESLIEPLEESPNVLPRPTAAPPVLSRGSAGIPLVRCRPAGRRRAHAPRRSRRCPGSRAPLRTPRCARLLPREQRRTVELAYFDGRTHREIAGLLDLPVGTVKGRLRLGLDKLRQALAAEAA